MRKSYKKFLSTLLTLSMAVGIGTAAVPQITDAASLTNKDKIAALTTTPYKAYLCFQTGNMYSHRNPIDDAEYGLLESADSKKISGYAWETTFNWNAPVGTELKDATYDDKNGNKQTIQVPSKTELKAQPATFYNPDITYDGTYTVSMSDFGDTVFQYDKIWQMLYINTNIPYSSGKSPKFSNLTLSVDGNVITTIADPLIRNKTDSKNTYNVIAINRYGYDDYTTLKQNTVKKDGAPDCLEGLDYPKKSISITFTISGMGEKPKDYTPSSGPAVTTEIPIVTPSAVKSSLKKGKTFTAANGLIYKVTKASTKKTGATVSLTGVKNPSSKKTSISVPATVSKSGFKYKVTAVNKNAFKSCKKLKKVSLGANLKTIDANAFANCKKLSALSISAKLSKVGKNAFKGCKKTIKVTGKSKAANVKKIKKSGYKNIK